MQLPVQKTKTLCPTPAFYQKATRWRELWLQKDFWSYKKRKKSVSLLTPINTLLLNSFLSNSFCHLFCKVLAVLTLP